MNEKARPFLKWPGGKYKLLDKILPKLPQSHTWVEPFVGAGAVFLNVNSEQAILNDINPDLINLYQLIKTEGKTFIDYAAQFFNKKKTIKRRSIINCVLNLMKAKIFYYAVDYFCI